MYTKAPVPQTDTGRRGENPKANGRRVVKELGKLTPQLREKGCLGDQAAVNRPKRLFTKNTGLCEVERRRIGADACPVPEG
jgi:hypothetical protein